MKMVDFVQVCLLTVIISFLLTLSFQEHEKFEQGRYTRDVEDFQKVVPIKVDPNGRFESYFLPYYYSISEMVRKREVNELLHYKIPIDGKYYHAVLSPNYNLFSPGMVIESIGPERKIKRAADKQCYYTGYVKDNEDLKVSLSTCYGLAGYVQTEKGHYFIEPVKYHDPILGVDHPHFIMKTDIGEWEESICVMRDTLAEELRRRRKIEERKGREDWSKISKYEIEKTSALYLEILLVLDWTFLKYHEELDVDNYVMTIMNMAYNLYHDASLGILIHLSVVRIIKLEEKMDEMNTKISKKAKQTLDAFCLWQKKINPQDDSHPNHHDVALLFTKIDICDRKTCGILGLSKLAGTCDADLSCAICEDAGLKLGFVASHEIGHTLGIPDDTQDHGCTCKSPKGGSTVMCPAIAYDIDTWSVCSERFVRDFIGMGFGKCLLDQPTDYGLKINDILPGMMYDGIFQCKTVFPQTTRLCKTEDLCHNLGCFVKNVGCTVLNDPASPGTSCGERKWCYKRQCLTLGKRPGAVDGGWGEWGPWSQCSRTCGSGVSFSERLCNSPQPANGGEFCIGERKRHRICNTDVCDIHRPSFRNVQCAEFNDKINPIDGKKYNYSEFVEHEFNPCALYCKSGKTFFKLRPKVIDGTLCYRGVRDICIDGLCREVPCDLDLYSDAKEDACGVCHGDGTSCDIVNGTRSFKKNPNKSIRAVVIPYGSVNIRIEETTPTSSRFTIANKNKILVKSNQYGVFEVPGSKGWFGMIRYKQEAIRIPGPIKIPLDINVLTYEDITISYSFGKPPKSKRKPNVKWDFLYWSSCSAECGSGTQISKPTCLETSGVVEDIHCKHLQKPKSKIKTCVIQPCRPIWTIGDWQDCLPCPKNAKMCIQSRLVRCMKTSGVSPETEMIVPDTECEGVKPISDRICTCPARRKRNYYADYDTSSNYLCDDDFLILEESTNENKEKLYTRSDINNENIEEENEHENRGKVIIDEDKDKQITIYLDRGDKLKLPEGVTRPPTGARKISLKGKDAVRFINMMRKQAKDEKRNKP